LKRFLSFLLFLLIIGLSSSIYAQEDKDYAFVTLPGGTRIKAEIVDTPEERAQGLMYSDKVEENEGMLFIFEGLGFYSFWMKNMEIPIDIIWLSPEGKIVYIAAQAPPCTKEPCPSYQPFQKAQYVLELAAGKAERENLKIGSALKIELPPDYPQ
jgi:uncharacterized membrane protein (UPF0127 family)